MRPLLVGVQDVPGGLRRYTFSVTPGRYVTITGPAGENTEDLAAELAARVAPIVGAALLEASNAP